jgi:hypothetical protein
MDPQAIVVGLIVLGAAAYVGSLLWKRLRSFAPKKAACGDDCGCGTDSKKVMR